MADCKDIVYVISTYGSSRDTKFTIYGERETAEKAFREQVASLKHAVFGEETTCPESYTVDEDYTGDLMFCTIYRTGWYDQENETVSLQPCPVYMRL